MSKVKKNITFMLAFALVVTSMNIYQYKIQAFTPPLITNSGITYPISLETGKDASEKVVFQDKGFLQYISNATFQSGNYYGKKFDLNHDGKNKRKNQQTIDVSKCEVIAPVESTYVSGYHRNSQMKSFDYTSGTGGEPVYIMIAPYGAASAKIYMEFDEKLLEAMKMAAPGKVKTS